MGRENGKLLVWYVIFAAWGTDSSAYFVGKKFACLQTETGQLMLKAALVDAGYTINVDPENDTTEADVTFQIMKDNNAVTWCNAPLTLSGRPDILDETIRITTEYSKAYARG